MLLKVIRISSTLYCRGVRRNKAAVTYRRVFSRVIKLKNTLNLVVGVVIELN